jgi:hypothetical protein
MVRTVEMVTKVEVGVRILVGKIWVIGDFSEGGDGLWPQEHFLTLDGKIG